MSRKVIKLSKIVNRTITFFIIIVLLSSVLFFGSARRASAEIQCTHTEMTFYYKPGCPRCEAEKPEVDKIEALGVVNVTRININTISPADVPTGEYPVFKIGGSIFHGSKSFEELKQLLGCQDVVSPTPPPSPSPSPSPSPGPPVPSPFPGVCVSPYDDYTGLGISGTWCCRTKGGFGDICSPVEQQPFGNNYCCVLIFASPSPSPTTPPPTISPTGPAGYDNPLLSQDIIEFIWRMIFVFFNIFLLLIVLFIIIGAYVLVTSGGLPSKIDRGKKIIIWALIGFVIIIIARGAIMFIFRILGR